MEVNVVLQLRSKGRRNITALHHLLPLAAFVDDLLRNRNYLSIGIEYFRESLSYDVPFSCVALARPARFEVAPRLAQQLNLTLKLKHSAIYRRPKIALVSSWVIIGRERDPLRSRPSFR
jgi:hypothetical protein